MTFHKITFNQKPIKLGVRFGLAAVFLLVIPRMSEEGINVRVGTSNMKIKLTVANGGHFVYYGHDGSTIKII